MLTSFLLMLLLRESYGFVCDPNQVTTLTEGVFPPAGSDSNYSANTTCHWQIIPPPGKYIMLLFNNLSYPYNLFITDNTGLDIQYVSDVSYLYSPITLNLDLQSPTNGSLQFSWVTINIPFDTNAAKRRSLNLTTTPSVLFKSEVGYNTSYVIQSSLPMVIQAAAAPAASYLMTAAFVFEGDGIGGKYLGSLYTFANSINSYTNITASTITIVSVSSFDYGIALVKPFAAIQGYNVNLNYASSQAIGTSLLLDGRIKDFAYTLYNPGDSDYYLNSANLGSKAWAAWVTGDISPNAFIITEFHPSDPTLFPQAIPGQLNTFVVSNGTVMIELGYKRPPSFDNVPVGAQTTFISRNFPYMSSQQGHQITYNTSYPAKVTVSGYFVTSAGSNGILVTASDVNGTTSIRAKLSNTPIYAYGNVFTFTYDNTTADAGAVVKLAFQKDNGDNGTKAGQLASSFWMAVYMFSMLKF